MKDWKLRLCKIAPCVTLTALFGYTCAVITEPTLLSPELNTLALAWLLVCNMATIGVLAFALVYSHVEDLRVTVIRSQRLNPRLRFLTTVPEPRPGHVYGQATLDDARVPSIEDQLRSLDPPTDDIRRAS